MISVAEPGGNCGPTPSLCTTFAYDANGERTQTTFPGGATLNFGYDNNWNTTSVVGKDKNGSVLTSFSYAYTNGNADTRLQQTMTENDAVANNTYTYSYDALNRLTLANVTAGSGSSYAYSYDSNGNMTRKTAGAVNTSYAYNAANELCWAYSGSSSNSCSSAPTGATTYTFDANGNETGNSLGAAFTYNPKNQTTGIAYGGTNLSPLTYSGTEQTQRTGAGSTTFNNGPSGVQVSTTSAASTYYLRDNHGNLIGERIGSNHYYYLSDALGSIRAVISGDGLTIGDRYGYDPYGSTTYQSGTTVNPWGYAAGFTDSTGLIKFGARYYDPGTARWTQVDPAACAYTNRYLYVADQPISLVDPSGLIWCFGIWECWDFHWTVIVVCCTWECAWIGFPCWVHCWVDSVGQTPWWCWSSG